MTEYDIFDLPTLLTYFQASILSYQSISSSTFDTYAYPGSNSTVTMSVSYLSHVGCIQDSGFQYQYQVTAADLGPLSLATVQDFLEEIDHFYLDFHLEHNIHSDSQVIADCFHWDLQQIYSYSTHGVVTVTLIPSVRLCDSALGKFLFEYAVYNVATLALAVAALVVSLISIRSRILLLAQLRGMENSNLTTLWMQLTLEDKLRFFGLWTVISLLSSMLQILGCISFFFIAQVSLDVYFRTIGFGCFFAWIELIQYLRWSPNSYAIINTLKRSFSTLWKYAFGILPVFMGFVYLGMALFWKSGIYNNTSFAMASSFAMINGDNLYGNFEPNFEANYIAGYIYMYIFFVLFISAIHNIFISIISDGFASLQKNPIKRGDEEDIQLPPIPKKTSKKEYLSKFLCRKEVESEV